MGKKILAFAGSNHSKSINYQLTEFAASQIQDFEVRVLDIRNWDLPVYSIDMDPDQTPDQITELIALIQEYDAFIIASPEHNGGTPAFLKNIIDWISRREKKAFGGKPVLMLSTSPGGRGGANNLAALIQTLPYQGANVVANFSLPSFYDNFAGGAVSGEQLEKLQTALQLFTAAVNE